jgi:hypothetical protein
MKYITLPNLSNKYPQPGNYIRKTTTNALAYDFTSGDSVLYGLYPETNQIPFYLPNLNAIRVIDNVSFRFILKVKKYSADEYPSYFTSFDFYADLESSIAAGNPYFINTALKSSFIVEHDLSDSLRYFKELQSTEENIGVKLLQNNFLKYISPELIQELSTKQLTQNPADMGVSNENFDFVNQLQTNPYLELIDENGIYVDYKLLTEYIDWVVKSPDLMELDNGGVISAETLTKYYSTPIENKISTTNDAIDAANKKVISDTLDKNAEITNPGGGGHQYVDGQSGSNGGGGYTYSGGGGGGGNYMQVGNYGNRQEYR